jgi:hypothetical protein
MIQWTRPIPGTGNGKGKQAIQDESDQKSGEKEEGRSRDHAGGFGVGYLLPGRVHFYICSGRCWRARTPEPPKKDNYGVIPEVDNGGVVNESISKSLRPSPTPPQ